MKRLEVILETRGHSIKLEQAVFRMSVNSSGSFMMGFVKANLGEHLFFRTNVKLSLAEGG